MPRLVLLISLALSLNTFAQPVPHAMTDAEKQQMGDYLRLHSLNRSFTGITTPPDSPVRASAEWEEIDALIITWTSQLSILKEIVRHSQAEARVYIVCTDSNAVKTYLTNYTVPLVNIEYLLVPFNSIWCRDYGPWNVYSNEVDSLFLIDWIYNRPREKDDSMPSGIMRHTGLPMYEMSAAPHDLVHTGGNFMVDGFGTAFSSELILDENLTKTESEIDTIMKRFMGITRYVKMETLPYDAIHHIDMHMKLLDEETILMAEYPNGIADGPQIEANLNYVLSNFNSVFGTPYKVVRIPSPPDASGDYPDDNGDYRTYTNSVFVNRTVIVPTYEEQYDTTALRIYQEALPGYNIVGINSNSIIPNLGAIHCITKEVAAADPLLISHQALANTFDVINPYQVTALIRHRSGINNATLYYRTDTVMAYIPVTMTTADSVNWTGFIPAQAAGTPVYYYVEATSYSGKTQVRPMPAPAGYWRFVVLSTVGLSETLNEPFFGAAFPNPASKVCFVPVSYAGHADIALYDITGRKVREVFSGEVHTGDKFIPVDVGNLSKGTYILKVDAGSMHLARKIVVK